MFKLDAEFWVAVAFAAFIGMLIYLGVHEMMLKYIDQRRDRIKAELDEAVRLKEEAQALLAQYQRKQREAEQEAAAIIAGATAEAERMMAEAKTKMEEFIARRNKMAEAKIAAGDEFLPLGLGFNHHALGPRRGAGDRESQQPKS